MKINKIRLVNSSDDFGNPIQTPETIGTVRVRYVLPVSDAEVVKIFGNRNDIAFKTISKDKAERGEIFSDSVRFYRIKEILEFPNKYNHYFLEVVELDID